MVLKVIKLIKSQNTTLSQKANEIRTIKATKKKKTDLTHLGPHVVGGGGGAGEEDDDLSLNGAQQRFLPLSLSLSEMRTNKMEICEWLLLFCLSETLKRVWALN